MMKKAKVFLCSLLVLCAVFFCMTALAAEDIVFTFENEASLAGWSTSYLRYNFDPGASNGSSRICLIVPFQSLLLAMSNTTFVGEAKVPFA